MGPVTNFPPTDEREVWHYVPADFWKRFRALLKEKWEYTQADFFADTRNAGIAEKTVRRAATERKITEESLKKLAQKLGFNTDWQSLLVMLGGNPNRSTAISRSGRRPRQEYPPKLSLVAGTDTPQGATYRNLGLWGYLKNVQCIVVTSSPYFRFGFKLLAPGSKFFGDGSIQAQDRNVVVHIGRNNFNRPGHSSPKELFVTAYRNGVRAGPDQRLFEVPKTLHVPVQLSMDDAGMIRLTVRNQCCYSAVVSKEMGEHLLMLAWADHDEFEVTVEGLTVECAE